MPIKPRITRIFSGATLTDHAISAALKMPKLALTNQQRRRLASQVRFNSLLQRASNALDAEEADAMSESFHAKAA